jgi:hypothetical protein
VSFQDVPIFAINTIFVLNIIIFILEKFKVFLDVLLNAEIIAIGVWISCKDIREIFLEFLRHGVLMVLDVRGPPLITLDLWQLDDVVDLKM